MFFFLFRKTHCAGRKHKENVKLYYQKWMEDQAQSLIDATTAAFMSGKLGKHPGNAIPPPSAAMPGPQPPIGSQPPWMPGPGMPGMRMPMMGPPGMGGPPGMQGMPGMRMPMGNNWGPRPPF